MKMTKKKWFASLGILLAATAYAADVKISQLPLGSASTTGALDSFPFVSASVNATKRLTLWDIANIPTVVSIYAPKASPVFTGIVTSPAFIVSGQTANTVPYLNASKALTSSAVTPTELGYVSGVTSALQTQLNAKLGTTLTSAHLLVGNGSAVATDVAMSGDVGISNTGATTIQAGAVDNSKVSASAAIAYSKLATLTSGNILVGSAGNVATSTAVTGDVTISNAGVTAIGSNKVANSQLAQMASHTFKGNNTGSTANAADLTATQATAELNNMVGDSGSGGTKGLVPAPAAGDASAGKFLKADGTWAVAGGGSAVTGNYTDCTSQLASMISGMSTLTNKVCMWRRVGNAMDLRIFFTPASTVASTFSITPPSSYTIDFSLMSGLPSFWGTLSRGDQPYNLCTDNLSTNAVFASQVTLGSTANFCTKKNGNLANAFDEIAIKIDALPISNF